MGVEKFIRKDRQGQVGRGQEGIARHYGYLVIPDGQRAEFRHIRPFGQVAPQEQTALDGMIRNSRGHKMFFHEIDHQLRFLAVNLLQSARWAS